MPRKTSARSPVPYLIDERRRVALPGEALAALKAEPGDYVEFVVEGNAVRIHRLSIERAST